MQPVGNSGTHNYHGLDVEEIYNALISISNARKVYKTYDDRYLIVTNVVAKCGDPIIAVIKVGSSLVDIRDANINKLVTIYPKRNLELYLNRINANALPDGGVNLREEDIGRIQHGVHVGDVQLVHIRQGRLVDGSAAHDEAFVGAGSLGLFVGLFEGIHAAHLRDGVSSQVKDNVLAALEGTEGQGEIGGPAHNYREPLGGFLEVFKIFGNVPRKLVFNADAPVVGNGYD